MILQELLIILLCRAMTCVIMIPIIMEHVIKTGLPNGALHILMIVFILAFVNILMHLIVSGKG